MDPGITFAEAFDRGLYVIVDFEDEIKFKKAHDLVLACACFFTIGATVGSYFAYKELRKKWGKGISFLAAIGIFLGAGCIAGLLPLFKNHFQLSTRLGKKYRILHENIYSSTFFRRIFA